MNKLLLMFIVTFLFQCHYNNVMMDEVVIKSHQEVSYLEQQARRMATEQNFCPVDSVLKENKFATVFRCKDGRRILLKNEDSISKYGDSLKRAWNHWNDSIKYHERKLKELEKKSRVEKDEPKTLQEWLKVLKHRKSYQL